MLGEAQIVAKKVSKPELVQSQLVQHLADESIQIDPSNYGPWQNDC